MFGCRIRVSGRFNPCDRFVVSSVGFGPTAVRAIWSNGEELGLAFEHPLHSTVVEHIRVYRDPPADEIERRWRETGLQETPIFVVAAPDQCNESLLLECDK